MFEQLPDMYVDNSKCKPAQAVNVSNLNATSDPLTKRKIIKTKKFNFHSALKGIIYGQNNDTI